MFLNVYILNSMYPKLAFLVKADNIEMCFSFYRWGSGSQRGEVTYSGDTADWGTRPGSPCRCSVSPCSFPFASV